MVLNKKGGNYSAFFIDLLVITLAYQVMSKVHGTYV